MTPNILPLHIPRGTEIFISVRETHKTIPLTLRRSLISNYPRFLYGRKLGEGFKEGLVRNFAREIADEEAEMRRIPFEEGRILPSLAAAGADDGFLFAAGVGDD